MIRTAVRTRLSAVCRCGAARGAGCGAHWLSTAGWVVSRQWLCEWVSVCVCVASCLRVCVCVCVLYSRCGRAEDSLGPGESVRIIWVELIRQVSLSYFFFLFFHPHIIFLKLSVSALRNFFFSKNHPAVWDSCLLMWCNSENIQLSTEKSPENKVSSTNCFFFFFSFFCKIFSFIANFKV